LWRRHVTPLSRGEITCERAGLAFQNFLLFLSLEISPLGSPGHHILLYSGCRLCAAEVIFGISHTILSLEISPLGSPGHHILLFSGCRLCAAEVIFGISHTIFKFEIQEHRRILFGKREHKNAARKYPYSCTCSFVLSFWSLRRPTA